MIIYLKNIIVKNLLLNYKNKEVQKMKLKKIKWENIYLIIVMIQFVDWYFKGALNYNCIIYYICIMIVYYTIKYFRKYKEDQKRRGDIKKNDN